MNRKQAAFVERRRRQNLWWQPLGALLLILLVGLYAYLYQTYPLYVDPQALINTIRANQLLPTEITRLAALGSFAFLACGLITLGLIVMTYVALWNEKRLLDIIREQDGQLKRMYAPPQDEA